MEMLLLRDEKEDEVDVFMQLKKNTVQNLTLQGYIQFWARTICGDLHDDLDNPPDLPAFCGNSQTPKKVQRESLCDAPSSGCLCSCV